MLQQILQSVGKTSHPDGIAVVSRKSATIICTLLGILAGGGVPAVGILAGGLFGNFIGQLVGLTNQIVTDYRTLLSSQSAPSQLAGVLSRLYESKGLELVADGSNLVLLSRDRRTPSEVDAIVSEAQELLNAAGQKISVTYEEAAA